MSEESPREMAARYRKQRAEERSRPKNAREQATEYRRRRAARNRPNREMDPYRGYVWNQPGWGTPPPAYQVTNFPNQQVDDTAAIRQANRIAAENFRAAMDWARDNGMQDFVNKYYESVLNGDITIDQAIDAFRETATYKSRFPAMSELRERGLGITESTYIAMERQYRELMTQAGVGDEYFDRNDIANLMLNDISPSEAAQRAQMAVGMVTSRDKDLLAAFEQYYGIKKSDLVAYYLNPDKALPILQRKAQAASIGAEVLRSDVDGLGGRKWAETLVGQGITQAGAREAFGQVAQQTDTMDMLGAIEGDRVSRKDQAEAVLGVDNKAEKKVRGMKSRERARFSGSAGGTRALGSGDAAGSY